MAKTFEELRCWQLARELKLEVLALTATGEAARDFRYRDQIRDSSASAPANIAEGFGRDNPGEFARFLDFARASLTETRNHLIDGYDRGYLADRLHSRLLNLCAAALRTTTALMRERQRTAARMRLENRRPSRA